MSGASTDTSQKIDKQKTGVQSSDSLHMKRKNFNMKSTRTVLTSRRLKECDHTAYFTRPHSFMKAKVLSTMSSSSFSERPESDCTSSPIGCASD